jgi:hypothetical protein
VSEDDYVTKTGTVGDFDQDQAEAIQALRGAKAFYLTVMDEEFTAKTWVAVPDRTGLLYKLFLEAIGEEALALSNGTEIEEDDDGH